MNDIVLWLNDVANGTNDIVIGVLDTVRRADPEIRLLIVGSFGGESIDFALGRFFGRRIHASKLGQLMGEQNWIRAETYLDRRVASPCSCHDFCLCFTR